MDWWQDHNNLADLWEWLVLHGEEPADGPTYFMEKPWKWTREYEMMRATGKP